jgi:hypothetical protein
LRRFVSIALAEVAVETSLAFRVLAGFASNPATFDFKSSHQVGVALLKAGDEGSNPSERTRRRPFRIGPTLVCASDNA